MNDLPLFPLNTVLFPGTPVHLHIFEERYKLMMGKCIEERQPFGVVLIRSGQEALGPLAEPHKVGCSAQIVHVQRLAEGRMNIVAMGQERFRILASDSISYPYLMGTVEAYPLEDPYPQMTAYQAQRLRQQVIKFIQIVVEAGSVQMDSQQIPENPVALAFMAAALLQVPPAAKQALLEMEQAGQLMSELQTLYRREIALVRAMTKTLAGQDERGFSLN